MLVAVRPVNVELSPSAVALRDLVLVLMVPVPDSVNAVVMPVVVLSLREVSVVSE